MVFENGDEDSITVVVDSDKGEKLYTLHRKKPLIVNIHQTNRIALRKQKDNSNVLGKYKIEITSNIGELIYL